MNPENQGVVHIPVIPHLLSAPVIIRREVSRVWILENYIHCQIQYLIFEAFFNNIFNIWIVAHDDRILV